MKNRKRKREKGIEKCLEDKMKFETIGNGDLSLKDSETERKHKEEEKKKREEERSEAKIEL